ncbi:MAG: cytochrome c oxidase subunit I, partial [Bacteroidia bacterium]|nr:cytochrome c oxidase subunit I [Bacteroidia bacterium]
PSAIKVFNYITTLFRGNLVFSPAMLFAIGLVSFFITGGLTGIILGDSTLDINVHDTYFVVAHFHIVMGSSAIFGMFAGIYHWFPRMYGRMMDNKLGYVHFWLTIISVYGVFFPMHFLGLAGVPRRYYNNTAYEGFDAFINVNEMITIFAMLGGVAQLIWAFNFFYSIYKGKEASQNPWGSTTLEWTAPVEHIHGNWPGAIPEVHRWPYDYGKPGAKEDFIPQTVPYSETPESNRPDDDH